MLEAKQGTDKPDPTEFEYTGLDMKNNNIQPSQSLNHGFKNKHLID